MRSIRFLLADLDSLLFPCTPLLCKLNSVSRQVYFLPLLFDILFIMLLNSLNFLKVFSAISFAFCSLVLLLSFHFVFTVPWFSIGFFSRVSDLLHSGILSSWNLIRALTTSRPVVFRIFLMPVLKASSALVRARALYCNVFGHVPL